MTFRLNGWWFLLLAVTGIFSLLYLWHTLFPGQVSPEALQYFTTEQINAGRDYSQTQRLLTIAGFVTQVLFLVWFLWSGRAVALGKWTQSIAGGSYLGGIILFFCSLWLALRLLNLPLDLYGSYFFQHSWGFSTQTLGAWWMDYLKGAGLDLIISGIGVILFFILLNGWPRTWWVIGAGLLACWLIIQSILWPVFISPMFNRFEPVKDPAILNMVEELSLKAGIPVEEVLVMDASRRTTKANAYFSGLGKTKQIVLYDNLLNAYSQDEVKAVLAHEMAHWRQGHIVKGLTLGVVGNFLAWGLLFLLLKTMVPPRYYPAHTWAMVLLFFSLVSFITSPVQNYISRSMEKEADHVSTMLTGDPAAAVQLQKSLVIKNVSDVSPPTFIEWFSYSHPSVLHRIRVLEGTN